MAVRSIEINNCTLSEAGEGQRGAHRSSLSMLGNGTDDNCTLRVCYLPFQMLKLFKLLVSLYINYSLNLYVLAFKLIV